MGYFKLLSKKRLQDLSPEEIISESDFATLTPDGTFVQLKYFEEDVTLTKYQVKPGVWTIQANMEGMRLEPTSFVQDEILESFVYTKEITDKIDCFFRRLHVYKKYGIDIPKRGMLLYGPPGTGKTVTINKAIKKYSGDGKTAIVVWNTDKFEAYKVKDFIKTFDYIGVEKLILIAEDIGGIEIDQGRMRSDSSLLSLLDNQEKTFNIPVLILATTNHPEVFLGNLTNRPNRFDDKIQVNFPNSEYRKELLKFFAKEEASEEALKLIESSKCSDFTPAHIRECVLRADIYEKSLVEVIRDIIKEIEKYKNNFSNQSSMGFSREYDD